MIVLQLSTLTKLRDLRLKVREIDVDGIDALRALTDLRSFDLEVQAGPMCPVVFQVSCRCHEAPMHTCAHKAAPEAARPCEYYASLMHAAVDGLRCSHYLGCGWMYINSILVAELWNILESFLMKALHMLRFGCHQSGR